VKYHITTIMPAGYIHSHCFDEVAELLCYTYQDSGHECTMAYNEFDNDATNIILGYHLLTKMSLVLPDKYVIYQLEPLISNAVWHNNQMLRLLSEAPEVWDYDVKNIAFLDNMGVKAVHKPLWTHPKLNRIKHLPMRERDIDFLFFGAGCARRTRVLNGLSALGFNVKHLFGVYGAERDLWIARSKVVLNIHQYDNALFEQVRVIYLENNGCTVVTV
jgi:hypothetical protein